jgi:hypothetical protein
MTLEDILRDQLHHQAADVDLPEREPGRAVARARSRRRNHRVAAGATVAVALLAAVVVPQLGAGGGGGDPVTAGPADAGGLPRTGPLTFDWQSADGGLSTVTSTFQAEDGTVYALSTGPGVRYEDHPDGDYPRALYRLADDGGWEAVPLEGDRPNAVDVTTDGGLLYAVSTGPDGSGGYNPQLSISSDRGDTWSVEDIAAVDPPSDVIPWLKTSSLAIESSGDTTLAVVSTAFRPNQEEVFPQLREPGAYARHQAVPQEDGFALVELPAAVPPSVPPSAEGAGTDTAPATTADGTTFEVSAPTTTAVDLVPVPATTSPIGPPADGGEVVELVPWAELGVSGIEALSTRNEVFRRAGDAWEPLEASGLDGVQNAAVSVSGGRFVATGFLPAEMRSVALTSTDGSTWSPLSLPADGAVVGVGSALVALPYDATVVHVSPDGGATWSEVDLADFGLDPGQGISTVADAGPLGLAFVTAPRPGTSGAQLVVSGDLADWTVTPLDDVVGAGGVIGTSVVVGADRVVVTGSIPSADPTSLPETRTAVGTPVRPG